MSIKNLRCYRQSNANPMLVDILIPFHSSSIFNTIFIDKKERNQFLD